jgi:hypothetical protein
VTRLVESSCNDNNRNHNKIKNYHPRYFLPMINTRRRQQHPQQAAALQQQDEMLDDLANGVERLKRQSLLIGDEAKLHLNLLGDMENQVDVAHSGLEGETRPCRSFATK